MKLEVTLNKNAWHSKLQSFVLGGSKPNLCSLCPYFWLTIFCITMLPIVTPFKLFILTMSGLVSLLDRLLDYCVFTPLFNRWKDNLKINEEIYIKFMDHNENIGKPFFMSHLRFSNHMWLACEEYCKNYSDGNSYENRWKIRLAYDEQLSKDTQNTKPKIISIIDTLGVILMYIVVKPLTLFILQPFMEYIINPIIDFTINYRLPINRIIIYTKLFFIYAFRIAIIGLFFLLCSYFVKHPTQIVELSIWITFVAIIVALTLIIMKVYKPIGIFVKYTIYPKIVSIFGIFGSYLVAAKNKVCPYINWKE